MAQADSTFIRRITPTFTSETLQSPTYNGSCQTNLEVKQKRKSNAYKIRHCCDITGCTATFARSYDLVRHKHTVHGPKMQCQHLQCSYATARRDKMKEHSRKKHLFQNAPCVAKETSQASLAIEHTKASGYSWYTPGLETNEIWTEAADLEAWAWVEWDPFWMVTA